MSDEKFCIFNFSHGRIKNKIFNYEKEYGLIVDNINIMAAQRNIRYFDINKNKCRRQLVESNDIEALKLMKRYNQINDAIKKLNGLMYNISEQQHSNINKFQNSGQKYKYKITESGKIYLVGVQLPTTEPDLIFDLIDYFKPIFSKTYEIKGTILECLIIEKEEDRAMILNDRYVKECLFISNKAFIKRTDNLYLVRNEISNKLEWSEQKYNINSDSNNFRLLNSNQTEYECIYRVVPFIKTEWIGRTLCDSVDINDRNPWDKFYKTVNTAGYIRMI